MKKLLLTIAIIFTLAMQSMAMPLIFKANRKFQSGESIQIDTTKYKTVSIIIACSSYESRPEVEINAIEDAERLPLRTLIFRYEFEYYDTEAVPSRLEIRFRNAGNYRVYVWGS